MPPRDEVLPEEELYKSALNIYFDRRFAEAYVQLMQFAHFYPNSRLTGNIWYWRGETLYALTCYTEADECFSTFRQNYPHHHKTADALLMQFQCRLELGRQDQAAETLRQLESAYPGSPQLKIARRVLEQRQSTP